MAQRWIAPRFGGVEVLELVDVEVPAPAPGEVTIAVRAVGINPSDAKLLGGGWNPDPSQLPLPIGQEAAGVVTAVGEGVPFAVGDEVIAFKVTGGFATDLTVGAKDVFPKPATLDFPAAANLLHVGVTAAELLHLVGVADGATILVHGASGSVGVSILQQAARRGIRVIGTASAASSDRVRQFGGEPVAYGGGLADRVRALAPAGIDAAIDAAGTEEALAVSLELVADPAKISTLAPGPAANEAGVGTSAGGAPASIAFRMPARRDILRLAADGKLVVPVARTFPFAEAQAALTYVGGGHPGGKVALTL